MWREWSRKTAGQLDVPSYSSKIISLRQTTSVHHSITHKSPQSCTAHTIIYPLCVFNPCLYSSSRRNSFISVPEDERETRFRIMRSDDDICRGLELGRKLQHQLFICFEINFYGASQEEEWSRTVTQTWSIWLIFSLKSCIWQVLWWEFMGKENCGCGLFTGVMKNRRNPHTRCYFWKSTEDNMWGKSFLKMTQNYVQVL